MRKKIGIDGATAQRVALQLPPRRAAQGDFKKATISRAEGGQLQAPVGRQRAAGEAVFLPRLSRLLACSEGCWWSLHSRHNVIYGHLPEELVALFRIVAITERKLADKVCRIHDTHFLNQ